MINNHSEKELREKIFKVRTKEEIDQMLLESEKEIDDPNSKWYTLEEIEDGIRRIKNGKQLRDKIS